jgi:hypothetical protein
MDRNETRAYVLHRLDRVGWKGDPKLDKAIFDPLFEATRGLPRTINAVCNRLFLGACLAEKHLIGSAEFNETIDEMRDELGPNSHQAAPPKVAQAAPREAPNIARPLISSALTARLERIEKSVDVAVELLQQISGADVPVGTAAMERRPRFGARLNRP